MNGINAELLRKIEDNLDCIVEKVEKLVEETQIANSELEEHQLRNIENMANSTDSIEALKLFIRYQIGRKKEWSYRDFGNKLISTIENDIKQLAQKIIKEDKGCFKAVYLRLIRLYIGFLVRSFIAKRGTKT